MERTFLQLATELEQVYGCNAVSVYNIYVRHNPLKLKGQDMEQYWEHTRRFLEELHIVLYKEGHQLSLHKILPESYYFLTKTCIDRSFTVTELIDVRNDREHKYSKDIANEIAHHVLPPYLTYRRQTINCTIDPRNGGSGPGYITAEAQSYAPRFQPQFQAPFHPQFQAPFQPQFQAPFQPQQLSWPAFMMPQPGHTLPSLAALQAQSPVKRIKPIVRRRPACISSGAEKQPAATSLTMPVPTDTDNVPLNFYTIYCSEQISTNSNTENHHIPQIFPVQNRPPPPAPEPTK